MVKTHGKFYNCLRKADRYANPISLTFNQEKKFRTPTGGLLTIASAIVILSWVAVQCFIVSQADYTRTSSD